jgi:redox-sensitive bicupin YhaK (pirin superfamily)
MLHGEVEHGDSMGNKGVIRAGDVQWMTAGSGIIHQEMPKGRKDGLMWGFQLWANLPASHKMMEPRYREVKNKEIPEHVMNNGAKVRIIAGEIDGIKGPVKDIVTEPEYLDVSIPAASDFSHAIASGHTAFAYVIDGAGYFGPRKDPYAYEMIGKNYFDFERESSIGPEHLVIYGDGSEISIRSESEGVRFLLVSGKPINEPVAWYGPIVMNTQEELKTAFEEYRNGTFLKHAK